MRFHELEYNRSRSYQENRYQWTHINLLYVQRRIMQISFSHKISVAIVDMIN